MPYAPGQVALARYHIKEVLATGRLGVSYKAHDRTLNADVVLKVLHASLTPDAATRRALVQHLQPLKKLQHRNIAQLFAVHEEGDQCVLNYQLVEGLALRTVMNTRARKGLHFSANEVRPLLMQLAASLQVMHSLGSVHGAVRAEDLVLLPDHLKVTGAGVLAQVARAAVVAAFDVEPALNLAPEIRAEGAITPQTDIWFMGALLYELCAGQPVWSGAPPLRAIDPTWPTALDDIVLRAVDPDPTRRYRRVGEFAAELQHVLAPPASAVLRGAPAVARDGESAPRVMTPKPLSALVPAPHAEPGSQTSSDSGESTAEADSAADAALQSQATENLAATVIMDTRELMDRLNRAYAESADAVDHEDDAFRKAMGAEPVEVPPPQHPFDYQPVRPLVPASAGSSESVAALLSEAVAAVPEDSVAARPSKRVGVLPSTPTPVVPKTPAPELAMAQAPRKRIYVGISLAAFVIVGLGLVCLARSRSGPAPEASSRVQAPVPSRTQSPAPGKVEPLAPQSQGQAAVAPPEAVVGSAPGSEPPAVAPPADPSPAAAAPAERATATPSPSASPTSSPSPSSSPSSSPSPSPKSAPPPPVAKPPASPPPPPATQAAVESKPVTKPPAAPAPAQSPGAAASPTAPTESTAELKCSGAMRLIATKKDDGRAVEGYCIDPYEFPGAGLPQTNISWDGAQSGCQQRGARLCTTAEWQRACWGTGGAEYPYGAEWNPAQCNTQDEQGADRELATVGSFKGCRSAYGIYDMSGNAAEWVAEKSVRGGAANSTGSASRCTAQKTGSSSPLVGFRCCAAPVGR